MMSPLPAPGCGTDDHRARQLGHDAAGLFVCAQASHIVLHLQVMRTNIGKGLAVLDRTVLGGGQAQAVLVFADQHLTLVGAAMEQVHIA